MNKTLKISPRRQQSFNMGGLSPIPTRGKVNWTNSKNPSPLPSENFRTPQQAPLQNSALRDPQCEEQMNGPFPGGYILHTSRNTTLNGTKLTTLASSRCQTREKHVPMPPNYYSEFLKKREVALKPKTQQNNWRNPLKSRQKAVSGAQVASIIKQLASAEGARSKNKSKTDRKPNVVGSIAQSTIDDS